MGRMKYNNIMFNMKNNLNGKEHTSQEGSLRVWKNWAHFSLLMSYLSQTVSSTPSWSAARAHFLVRSDLNCLHLSPTVCSNFFFVLLSEASGISNSAWQHETKFICYNNEIFWLLITHNQIRKEKYLNILPNQVLLSSRDLLPVLVGDVHLITCHNPQICS